MKICQKCKILFREQVMACAECRAELHEVSLQEALDFLEQKALHNYISGPDEGRLSSGPVQYHIRCYLANRSLFLDFDLYKNHLKRGRRTRRFFIAPVNINVIINLPWFLFNVISSNLFHLQYTEYCPRCDSKFIKGRHGPKDCDYNIEYFHILDDILSGKINKRKIIYEEYSRECKRQGRRSAYIELFERPVRWETFWDFLSVTTTILVWLFVAVCISFPMLQVLVQKLQHIEAYEWTFLTLR